MWVLERESHLGLNLIEFLQSVRIKNHTDIEGLERLSSFCSFGLMFAVMMSDQLISSPLFILHLFKFLISLVYF